jgi:hypothetical protein
VSKGILFPQPFEMVMKITAAQAWLQPDDVANRSVAPRDTQEHQEIAAPQFLTGGVNNAIVHAYGYSKPLDAASFGAFALQASQPQERPEDRFCGASETIQSRFLRKPLFHAPCSQTPPEHFFLDNITN